MAKKALSRNSLIFVDTNIYLDFYRARKEAGLSLLEKLEGLKDCLIVTEQVEMEFKKNRHLAILESLNLLKTLECTTTPAFLAQSRAVSTLKKKITDVNKRIKSLQKHLLAVLADPTGKDKVYKITQRLFRYTTDIHLKLDNENYSDIVKLSKERFMLGYPPRKSKDTSMGDALNWEWIIHCAQISSGASEIIIVSRDEDYGCTYRDHSYINDWLNQEFKTRVSNRKKVILVDRLSEGLKLLKVSVTKSEEEEEEQIVATERFHDEFKSLMYPHTQYQLSPHYEDLFRQVLLPSDSMKVIAAHQELISSMIPSSTQTSGLLTSDS